MLKVKETQTLLNFDANLINNQDVKTGCKMTAITTLSIIIFMQL